MCCSRCSRFHSCRSVITVRMHPTAERFMVDTHYHLCQMSEKCEFDCERCGKLLEEMPHPPKTLFKLGCCHRCAEYAKCDFVSRHLEEIKNFLDASVAPEHGTPPADAQAAVSAIPSETKQREQTQCARVLLVDDDPAFRDSVTDFFARDPLFSVQVVADGFTAVKQLLEFRPHVVVLDLRMPEMDGLDLCQTVRHSRLAGQTRVLVVTGYPTDENLRKAKEAGADLCLSKPVELDDLRDHIRRLAKEVAGSMRRMKDEG